MGIGREAPAKHTHLNTASALKSLLDTFNGVTDYRTLRDSLPRRVADLLKCRCVLLYQRLGETLQFASGSFDDRPGWASSLLAVTHINPIDASSDTSEALACRLGHAVTAPGGSTNPTLVAVPLLYRQRPIGVLVAIRGDPGKHDEAYAFWSDDDIQTVEAVAGVAAMLLENTRLLERDRERIQELSLLNSISNQLHRSMLEPGRVRSIIIQHTREISAADACDLLLPSTPPGAVPWITPALQEMLLKRLNRPPEQPPAPLVIERPGYLLPTNRQTPDDTLTLYTHVHKEYLSQLAETIKTFFAIPLIGNRTGDLLAASEKGPHLLGVLVGAYHRPWKLRHEELILLHVLASQAATTLENIALAHQVVEARNQARTLLHRVLDDVSSIHHLEEERRRLDRLASLGEMAANIAHEVRNPLASIKASAQMLLYDLSDSSTAEPASGENHIITEAREALTIVLKEVERLDTIVRELLLFARPRHLQRAPCDLVALSDDVLQLVQAQCEEAGVKIRRVYQEIPPVQADVAQMEQVVLNLCMNAIQAMPGGGVLTITCRTLPGQVELAVTDTGVGIAPEQLERIFQPFFTTKAHGIGLGLSITRRLIEDHHGQIHVESQPGYGTTITLHLPLAGDEAIQGEGRRGKV